MPVGSEHFRSELSSSHGSSYMAVGNEIDQITSTYAELTPLQPLSPVNQHDPSTCSIDVNSLQFYENLEPLSPTAMLNDRGQLEPCTSLNGFCSGGGHSYFLPPVDCLDLAKTFWSGGRSPPVRNGLAKLPSTESDDVGNSDSAETAGDPSTPTRSLHFISFSFYCIIDSHVKCVIRTKKKMHSVQKNTSACNRDEYTQ